MNKLAFVLILALSTIAGCSSEADNAKKLGFINPEQMKYLNGLGFKSFEEFKAAHPYVVKSDSIKFAESGLGLTANLLGPKKDSDSGEYYEGPKGVWMLADETGSVSMVGYSCIIDKSKINASIDNIGCDSNSSDLNIFKKDANKYCGYDNNEELTIFIKNNAFLITTNAEDKVEAFGLLKSPKYFAYGQTFYDKCDAVYAKVNASKSAGFESIYEMDEAAKLGIKTGSDWKRELGKKKFKEKYSKVVNSLEKSMIVLVSTQKDFRDFKDNGSLNVNNDWRGYKVSSIEVEYTKDVLTLFHLVVDSNYSNKEKPATFNNLKLDLVDECGSKWDSRGRSDVYWSDSEFSSCEISQARQGGYHVVVSVKSKKD